jgi:hypothetical protein
MSRLRFIGLLKVEFDSNSTLPSGAVIGKLDDGPNFMLAITCEALAPYRSMEIRIVAIGRNRCSSLSGKGMNPYSS